MSTLPNNQGVMFDADSAKTIVKVVNAATRNQGGRFNGKPPGQQNQPGWYARITGENPARPGNYSWIKQQLVNGALVDATDTSNGDTFSASESNGTTGIAIGTKVSMVFAGYDLSQSTNPTGSGSGSGSEYDPGPQRYMFVYGGGTGQFVRLVVDGGYPGDAATYTEASWTYTIYDINTGIPLAYRVPLYGHRPLAQVTYEATVGCVFRVTDPNNTGVSDSAGVNALGVIGSGSGSVSSGSGSGSGYVQPPQLIRIYSCDESFPMIPACDPINLSGSGSGSGSGD